ncbi:MFS transporter [Candidatus Peregrinibacteria bacterium]|nr:MFS transporter [Candidatus Peregrinibacteria bacterium]
MPKLIFILSAFELCRMALGFYLPLYFKNFLHFSGAQIGLIFGLGSLTSLLTILPIGAGNDRITPKRMAIAGILLTLVCYVAVGFVGAAFAGVLALFLLRDIGQNLFSQSGNALMYKLMGQKKTGKFFGWVQLFLALGDGTGMIAGGLFLMAYGFDQLFIALSVMLVFLILIAWDLPQVKTAPVTLLHYRKEVFRPRVALFILIFFLFAFHFGAEATSYGLFLSENLHLSQARMGYYMAVELIFLGAAAFYLGRRYDRRQSSLKNIIFIGLLASGIGHMGMIVPNVWISVAFRALHGWGDGAIILAMRLGINRFFKIESVGSTSGLVNFIMIIGNFTSALLFGPLGERWGYEWPLLISGITTVFICFLVQFYRHLLEEKVV